MQFESKVVKNANPNLTQEEALESLYSHPQWREGTRVKSIKRRGAYWVAHILEPRIAEFPPKDEEKEEGGPPAPEGPPSDGPPGEDEPDDEFGPKDDPEDSLEDGGEEGPPKKDKGKGHEGAEIAHILDLIRQIAEAVGVPIHDEGLLGPEGPADVPPGPELHGGPPGGDVPPPGPPGGPKPGRPIKPGEAPPGATPNGAPAFASTRQSNACPHCGGPVGPDGTCPACGQSGYAKTPSAGPSTPPGVGGPPGVVGRAATITVSGPDMPVKEAKADLEKEFGPQGYKVKQIKRAKVNSGEIQVHALLSVR